ncbi:MAG: helix-turn-helix domain containing protein [Actinophytocola sp.]|nr:helix-turn-helix domain containing protein [Actinophytocola sp.]
MTNVEAHRTHIRMGSTTYDVDVEALEFDEAEYAEHAGRVAVNVVAAGEHAEVIAEGTLEVDIAAAGTLGTVLAKALRSVAAVAPGDRSAAAANRGKPWTAEMDAELERQWVAGAGVADIARHFERSPGSIRARLPRVGCDPVTPGAYLPVPPSRRAS